MCSFSSGLPAEVRYLQEDDIKEIGSDRDDNYKAFSYVFFSFSFLCCFVDRHRTVSGCRTLGAQVCGTESTRTLCNGFNE